MAEYKKLYRSKHDRKVAGICGGIAQYFQVDPVPIRVIWAITCFIGLGILMYLIAWIIIPEEP
jgi:phage shock protein PspC (stress-responsive transcriptional regulator)